MLEEQGREVARSIGDAAIFERLDVGSEADWTRVVDAARSHGGRLTTLVNNAGVVGFSAFEETSLDDYMRIIRSYLAMVLDAASEALGRPWRAADRMMLRHPLTVGMMISAYPCSSSISRAGFPDAPK